jgi:hypothetical protein
MQGFGSNSEVHNAGEVWASMLFEAYIALIREEPRLSFSEAQRRMSDYIVAGMMMAPPHPTFTEQRDAILAAAAASDKKDLEVLARAFARRGAGTGAESPPRESGDFEGVKESFVVAGDLVITEASVEIEDDCDGDGNFDTSDTGTLHVSIVNSGPIDLGKTTVSLENAPSGVSLPDGSSVTISGLRAFEATDVRIPITLGKSMASGTWLKFKLEAANPDSIRPQVATVVSRRVNFDDAPEASASDDVESSLTAWAATAQIEAEYEWRRLQTEDGTNMLWHADDAGTLGDQMLESPVLSVGSSPFVVRFEHRYKFEASTDEETGTTTYWDGGVIELSLDNGKTWIDVSEYTDPGYGGTLTDESQNPLGLRPALVGKSSHWPELTKTSLNFGTKLAGKNVKLRFRLGTDAAVGDEGWQLDNFEAEGITNTPFTMVVDDSGACSGEDTSGSPDSSGGGCATRPSGRGGWSVLLVGFALLLIRRRRRVRLDLRVQPLDHAR